MLDPKHVVLGTEICHSKIVAMSFEQVCGIININMHKVSSASQKLFDKTWDQVSGVWLFTWDSNGCVALHRSLYPAASTDVKHFFLSIFNPYEDALSAFVVSNTLSGNRMVSLICKISEQKNSLSPPRPLLGTPWCGV